MINVDANPQVTGPLFYDVCLNCGHIGLNCLTEVVTVVIVVTLRSIVSLKWSLGLLRRTRPVAQPPGRGGVVRDVESPPPWGGGVAGGRGRGRVWGPVGEGKHQRRIAIPIGRSGTPTHGETGTRAQARGGGGEKGSSCKQWMRNQTPAEGVAFMGWGGGGGKFKAPDTPTSQQLVSHTPLPRRPSCSPDFLMEARSAYPEGPALSTLYSPINLHWMKGFHYVRKELVSQHLSPASIAPLLPAETDR